MDVTVILCTYNRAASLATALDSVAGSRMPEDVSWEVLVVDNNSNDDTRRVVDEFVSRYPGRFRYAFEPQPGKSNALNSAIRNNDAPILAFIDDDVQADPDWLQELTSVFADRSYTGSGGRIFPERGFRAPAWLDTSTPYSLAPLAMFDLGNEAGELKEPPFGTNMAFRSDVFVRYGEFRRDLGPQPGSEIRSEDTEFGLRVLLGGDRLRYVPSAVVYHAVSSNRLTKEYFLRWWYGKGRGDMRESGLAHDQRARVIGIPLVSIKRISAWTVRWWVTFDRAKRFGCKAKVWWLAGYIHEAFALSQKKIQLS